MKLGSFRIFWSVGWWGKLGSFRIFWVLAGVIGFVLRDLGWESRRDASGTWKLGSFRILGHGEAGETPAVRGNWVRFAEMGRGGTPGIRRLGSFRIMGTVGGKSEIRKVRGLDFRVD